MHSGGKAAEAAGEKAKQQKKVDYLSIERNVAANQLTVSSVASGNLALYEVWCGQTDCLCTLTPWLWSRERAVEHLNFHRHRAGWGTVIIWH